MTVTELKNLKELEDKWLKKYLDVNFIVNDLRQEAIEWIKELEKASEQDRKEGHGVDRLMTDGKIVWIKHFFNLTEEDLNG